jgi:hypothetical protein
MVGTETPLVCTPTRTLPRQGGGDFTGPPHTIGAERYYSPSPSGRGRDEGQVEAGRALAHPMLPYAEVETAVGCHSNGTKSSDPFAEVRGRSYHALSWYPVTRVGVTWATPEG